MASNPTLLVQPIAQNGTKNAIPNTTTTPGVMSQDQGFPAETSLPLGAGGVAPDRADFNGAFNLLGGVAYYAQKGWRFHFDEAQEYFKGCIVIDDTDGNAYQALADVAAGGSVPSADNTNWKLYAEQLTSEARPFIPAFNKKDVVTVSGNYVAPVTGWYKVTIKGGGGGGGGGNYNSYGCMSGSGGGEGGTTIGFEKLTAGQTASVVIGAGGTGGAAGSAGNTGGNSSVTINNNIYLAGGGGGGPAGISRTGAAGGTGDIPGAPGGPGEISPTALSASGGNGGGNGGARVSSGGTGTSGGGGAGGVGDSTSTAGGNGGDGFAWFEYFDPSLM